MKVLASVPLALICQGADSRPPGILRRCQHLSGRTAFISVLRLNLPWNRPRTASNLWLEGSPHSPPLPTSAHWHGASETHSAPAPYPLAGAQAQRQSSRRFGDDRAIEGGRGSTRAIANPSCPGPPYLPLPSLALAPHAPSIFN